METLSDKRNIQYSDAKGLVENTYPERDVKEFIRKLKRYGDQSHKMIDELAGDKLICAFK